MRTGALVLLLLTMTACSRGADAGNGGGAGGNGAELSFSGENRSGAATLALATVNGNCTGRWDGQPATPQQAFERSAALIEQAIAQHGSVDNLTEEALPAIAVTAPAGLGFACADAWLGAIRRAGVPTVLLAADGQPAAFADFALSDIGAPPPSVVIAVGAGGRLTWNRDTITPGTIPERVNGRPGGSEAGIETLHGELELRPAWEASFGQVYDVLRALRASHARATLLLPSVTPGRRPAPEPAPAAPAPVAADNVTTPAR